MKRRSVPLSNSPAVGFWQLNWNWTDVVVKDDWDVSDSEKPKKPAAAANAGTNSAPPKKKMTLKQKLAEKERLAAEPVSPTPRPDSLVV